MDHAGFFDALNAGHSLLDLSILGSHVGASVLREWDYFPHLFWHLYDSFFSHTAVEDKDLYSLKMFCFRGKSEGDWSQLLEPLQITLLYGNSHCKPDISSVFCSQEFLGSPSIGMDRLTLAVCFVLSPPKQLRKSHSPLGKSECFKSL